MSDHGSTGPQQLKQLQRSVGPANSVVPVKYRPSISAPHSAIRPIVKTARSLTSALSTEGSKGYHAAKPAGKRTFTWRANHGSTESAKPHAQKQSSTVSAGPEPTTNKASTAQCPSHSQTHHPKRSSSIPEPKASSQHNEVIQEANGQFSEAFIPHDISANRMDSLTSGYGNVQIEEVNVDPGMTATDVMQSAPCRDQSLTPLETQKDIEVSILRAPGVAQNLADLQIQNQNAPSAKAKKLKKICKPSLSQYRKAKRHQLIRLPGSSPASMAIPRPVHSCSLPLEMKTASYGPDRTYAVVREQGSQDFKSLANPSERQQRTGTGPNTAGNVSSLEGQGMLPSIPSTNPTALGPGQISNTPQGFRRKGLHSLVRRASIVSAAARTIAAVKNTPRSGEISQSVPVKPLQWRRDSAIGNHKPAGRHALSQSTKARLSAEVQQKSRVPAAFKWSRATVDKGDKGRDKIQAAPVMRSKAALSHGNVRTRSRVVKNITKKHSKATKLVRVNGVLYRVSGTGSGRSLKRQSLPKSAIPVAKSYSKTKVKYKFFGPLQKHSLYQKSSIDCISPRLLCQV